MSFKYNITSQMNFEYENNEMENLGTQLHC